eukprot:534350-Amphidinium_carterae.1
MGINLEASRAKMDEQSAAVRAQLEVELSRIRENQKLKGECEQGSQDLKKLKAECEQGLQDAKRSEKRERLDVTPPTGGIDVMGPQMGIAMTDQDIASAFVKRRLPTKVPRPSGFGVPETQSNSNRSYVSPDGVLHRPKKGEETTTPNFGQGEEPRCCKCRATRTQL